MRYLSIPVLIIFLFASSCDPLEKKCKESSNGIMGFTFEIPYSVSPSKDTFEVGDTLWIESEFSRDMYNLRNGKTYTLDNFDFKLSANLYDMTLNPLSPTPYHVLLNEDGTHDNSHTDFEEDFPVNYSFEQGRYRWKKGFVVTHTGLFLLAFYKGLGAKSLQQQNPPQRITDCSDEYVQLNIKCKGASNSYLRQYAAEEGVRSWPEDHGSFAFYVKP